MPAPDEIPEDVRNKLFDWYNAKVDAATSQSRDILADTYPTYSTDTKFQLVSYNAMLMLKLLHEFTPDSKSHIMCALLAEMIVSVFAGMSDEFINAEYARSVTPDIDELTKMMGDFKL